jgi:hypothetical protein
VIIENDLVYNPGLSHIEAHCTVCREIAELRESLRWALHWLTVEPSRYPLDKDSPEFVGWMKQAAQAKQRADG